MSSARLSRTSAKKSKSNQSLSSRRLSLSDYKVTQVCINASFVEILLAEPQGSIAIGISKPFSMRQNGKEQTLDLKDSKSLAPVLVLINKEANYLDIYRDGSLKLTMCDGRTLSVNKDGGTDAWFTSGAEKLEAVEVTETPPKRPARS